MKLVVVVGPLGSGTSAVAGVIHRLGIPMAMTTTASMPPKYRSEWEDHDFLRFFIPICPFGHAPNDMDRIEFKQRFSEHLKFRQSCHERIFAAFRAPLPGIGIKCPMLALFLSEVREVAKELGYELKLVVCERGRKAIDLSIHNRHGKLAPDQMPNVLKTQSFIKEAIAFVQDAKVVQYGRLVNERSTTIAELSMWMEAPRDIVEAVEMVEV